MTLASSVWTLAGVLGGPGGFAHARFSMSPRPSRGVVPGAEGMREPDLLLHFLTIFQKENDPLFNQSDWGLFPG